MFTATVLMPWLPWMDMDDVEGHTLWHASGVKLDSIDQLPEEYSKRMMAEHPELSGFNLERYFVLDKTYSGFIGTLLEI